MSYHKHHKDKNHDDIVKALKRCGIQVYDASHFGGGFPDLVTSFRNVIRLVEIKDGEGIKEARHTLEKRLTPAQKEFMKAWPVSVVTSIGEALAVHGILIDEAVES